MSHLDESQQDFCFPVLLYRGKASEVVAVPVQNSPQKLTACCQHHQNTSQATTTTTTAQDSAQALGRRAGVKN